MDNYFYSVSFLLNINKLNVIDCMYTIYIIQVIVYCTP